MKILMLSWEFPPKVVGGLARHVDELSAALVRAGHEVHVITGNDEKSAEYEVFKGIHVHRIKSFRVEHLNFVDEIFNLNLGMIEYGIRLLNNHKFDMVHAHDWLVAHAGITLKRSFGIPLFATIHATEHGRWSGIHNELQNYIHSMEWHLNYESVATIVCSNFMKAEVQKLFNKPADQIFILPNGVEAEKFSFDFDQLSLRRKFAYDYEKLIVSVGRMVPEKGFQTLLESAGKILSHYQDAKFVIAGKGGMLQELRKRAEYMGLNDKVWFAGFVDDDTLNKLMVVADAAVFPSLYEPFGITALEGMAAGTPIVVSDTGGLGEIVDHSVNGIKTYAGDADSLAWGIEEIIFNSDYAYYLRENAFNKVHTVFNWDRIAEDTTNVYNFVLG